ncbi:MAG: cell division protein FtsZ [Elusimicrobiota bacterium]
MTNLDIYNVKEANIKIIGVGGGGGNTINRIASRMFKNVDLIAANTDIQALRANSAPIKISLGMKLTKGLGVGGDPEKGKQAAIESIVEIENCIKGADLVIITAGLGGGTGTGAAPVIAQVAKKMNALIMAVVTKPFKTEGAYKMGLAEKAIEELKPNIDAMIIIPNDKLLMLDTTSKNAYQEADKVVIEAITGITDLITTPSMINVDFADIESILRQSGTALIGIGEGTGERRHMEAIKKALSFPLIENADIQNSKGLIVYFKCSDNFKTKEQHEVLDYLNKKVSNSQVKIKFGQHLDNDIAENKIYITVIAAGFGYEEKFLTKPYYEILNDQIENQPRPNEEINMAKPAYLRRRTSILD